MVADFLLRTAMAELTEAHARAGDPLHLYPPFLAHQHRFAPVTLVRASPWLAVARSARPRVCRAAVSPCRVRATPVPLLAPRVRLDAGKLLVVTSPPASSPAARAGRSTATSASAPADAWVRLGRGSRVTASLGALHRVYLAYLGRWIFVLKKGISKMVSKID